MQNIYAGLDEAALGPVLGPYCATVTSFSIEGSRELYEIFENSGNLAIGDSKKIYTSGKSLASLEKTALAFLYQIDRSVPPNLHDILKQLQVTENHLAEIKEIPWFRELDQYRLPLANSEEEIRERGEELTRFMKENAVKLRKIQMDVVPARRFNEHLLSGKNKGETCLALLAPLLRSVREYNSRITVDRQGGRRYYGEWLLNLFPGEALAIRRELADVSEYDVGSSTIRFLVKGDEKHMETSLASIFSKYIREAMMLCFNDYWSRKIPGLKKTAGYPQDGKRFIRDLKRAEASYEEATLIRMK